MNLQAARVLFLLGIFAGGPALAQPYPTNPTGNYPTGSLSTGARDRYERTRKGADIKEWVKRLHSEDSTVRFEAVKSLGDSQDAKAIEYLVEATGDSDLRVKIKAIEYLGSLRATDATPVLVQELVLRDTSPELKQRILVTLGKIGDSRAAAPIAEFLERNLDGDICGTAIFALGEIGDPAALSVLEKWTQRQQEPILQRLAAEAISKIHQRKSLQPVVPSLPALAQEGIPPK